jgi:hypothetical protein
MTPHQEFCAAALIIGVVISLYQGCRGFFFQWLRDDKLIYGSTNPRKFLLLALSDGILYFATTASGFFALAIFHNIIKRISDPAHVDAGSAALLVFLAIYGLFGITAQLPHLIQSGKLIPPLLKGGD